MITTPEQEELRAVVRGLLARHPVARPEPERPHRDGRAVWTPLAGQVGACALLIPEEHGGADCTLAETHVVCEELGRTLAPVPYLASAVLATEALLAYDAADVLPELAAGEKVATLAWAEQGTWDTASIAATERDGRLTGVKDYVLDGADADLLLVPARTAAGGLGLYLVEAGAPGLVVEASPVLDPTRPLARVVLDGTPARRLTADAAPLLDRLLAVAATALSAEQVGGAQHCLDMTVAYAKTRVQFGRPIGSFQAVKHRLADLYVLVESARSASYHAAAGLAENAPDAGTRAALAKAYCSEAFTTVAAETVQLHGGIGFTWEHDAHLYFKRAHGSALLFGDPAWHRARLGDAVLGVPPKEVVGSAV
ncbi:acyl-CoA dehydrogenase family protein [Actinomadura hibisca]|uniref:acyl-CoA dehydrogenase family protein n=1 Tax=Actinomadura hibisca TaxID=68565 RepID=UPI00082ECB97|nr:acyl-CoA dehydrogenase family protein [Actinomadura hibisca]